MSTEKLHESLNELHRQLELAGSIDSETRAHLQAIMHEVRQVLAEAGPGSAVTGRRPPAAGGLIDRVRTSVEQFEVDHPRLSAALANLIEALRKL